MTFRVSWLLLLMFIGKACAEERPNILFILTDDQGWGDVSLHGNPHLQTPNMDRIAKEGARFERFFVEPVCAPTRAAILTGRYPTATGVYGVTRGAENMASEEVTIAELLASEEGYETGCFGKWHNGAQAPYHPLSQGFHDFTGFCGGHWNHYFDPVLERRGREGPNRGFIADILTDDAIRFMKRNLSQPWFCFLTYNTPHTPASVPQRDWERWANHPVVEDNFTRAMYALVENLDQNIGRLLAHLDESPRHDNTIVIFLTDNGPNGDRFNGEMLGRKGSVQEGGVRVPCFVRWPAKIKPGTVIEENHAHIDLLPTLTEAAGITNLDGRTKPLHGIRIPELLGEEAPAPEAADRLLFTWRNGKNWSVRSHRYRASPGALHDLIDDPSQETNLVKEKAEIHQQLVEAYKVWSAENLPKDRQPLPVHLGLPGHDQTRIKAHELDVRPAEGDGIAYCSRRGFANQWIEKWTEKTAFAVCPIRVASAGTYEVTIEHHTTAEQKESWFRVDIGPARLDFKIDTVFVSAAYPAPEQGPKEPGGYLSRDWRAKTVGQIQLDKGDHELVLRALEMPGQEMPHLKSITFRKTQ